MNININTINSTAAKFYCSICHYQGNTYQCIYQHKNTIRHKRNLMKLNNNSSNTNSPNTNSPNTNSSNTNSPVINTSNNNLNQNIPPNIYNQLKEQQSQICNLNKDLISTKLKLKDKEEIIAEKAELIADMSTELKNLHDEIKAQQEIIIKLENK